MRLGAYLVEMLLDLCRVPSVTGKELQLCDVLERLFIKTIGRERYVRVENNLLVEMGNDPTLPRIIIAGHLDTVNVAHDGPPRVDGDRIYGAGASDMKAGLAIMLGLLWEALNGASPRYNFQFVFYAKEEGPYLENGLHQVFEAYGDRLKGAYVAVFLEPSDNKVQCGCLGGYHAHVTFTGKSCHSARPWQGENAISLAVPFLLRLYVRLPASVLINGLEYVSVVSATQIQANWVDGSRNVIPASCVVNVNGRIRPDQTFAEARAELEALVAGEGEIRITDQYPSAPTFRDHPFVAELLVAGAGGPEAKQAYTDVGLCAREHGIPAINLGPGVSAQAHQRNEWTTVSGLEKGFEIFHRALFIH